MNFKNNKLFILILIVLTIFISIDAYQYSKVNQNMQLSFDTMCNNVDEVKWPSLEYKDSWIQQYGSKCGTDVRYDAWTSYAQSDRYFTRNFPMVIPALIIILVCYDFCMKYRSGYFKNEMLRKPYKKIIISYIKSSYFKSLLAPFTGIMIFICFSFVSSHLSFNQLLALYGSEVLRIPTFYYNIPYLYYTLFILALLIYGLILANITMIIIKRIRNVFVSVLTSYVAYQVLDSFNINVIGYILTKIINVNVMEYLSTYCVWNIYVINHILVYILFLLSLFIITSIILYFTYRNKESVVIESEK